MSNILALSSSRVGNSGYLENAASLPANAVHHIGIGRKKLIARALRIIGDIGVGYVE